MTEFRENIPWNLTSGTIVAMPGDVLAVFDDVVRLETELWNAVECRLRDEHDLALTWFEVTRVVARCEPATVSDIVRELIITIGGVSKLVDRIEAAGYVRRTANPDDGRSSLIHVTASGKRLLSRVESTVDDELQSLLGSALPPKAWNRFAKNLRTIRKALPHHLANNSQRTA
jgi:DNA-binding MarR family transcriptional regulator